MSKEKIKIIYHLVSDNKITEDEFITILEDENTSISCPFINWTSTSSYPSIEPVYKDRIICNYLNNEEKEE